MKQYSLKNYADRALSECTDLELYNAALRLTTDAASERGFHVGRPRLPLPRFSPCYPSSYYHTRK